jgi:hypothetical protein
MLNSNAQFSLRLNNDVIARDMENPLRNEVKGDLDRLWKQALRQELPRKARAESLSLPSIVHRIMERQTLSKSVAHFFATYCLLKT